MILPTTTPLKKRRSLYSDFHKDLTVNPISGDLALKKDETSVKEAIKNLLLTDRGERLFQPDLGGDIRSSLFDNNTPMTLKILEEKVRAVLNNFEPRINLIEVQVTTEYNSGLVKVVVYFNIRNVSTPISVTVFLERTR